MALGAPMLVSANVAGVETPLTAAVTVYAPAVPLAVTTAVATPAALVEAVVPMLAEAPALGTAVKVTATLLSALPLASVTSADSFDANAVEVRVLWLLPKYAYTLAAE